MPVRTASERKPSPYWMPSTTVLNSVRTALRSCVVQAVGQEAELPGDAQINVAAFARLQQRAVAGQHRGNADLLLAVVAMHQRAARRRRDQEPQPFGRAEHVLRGAWRVARGLGAVGPQRRAVAVIVPDCEIVEPQLRQRVAQLAQRLDMRIVAGHFAKRLVAFVERSVLVGRPAIPVPADVVGEPILAPMRLAVDDLVAAERAIELGHQIELHVRANGCGDAGSNAPSSGTPRRSCCAVAH